MATAAITPDQDTVVAEIFIAAPPERVFEAITDPKQMPLWWGQKDVYRITDWTADLRVGGKWSSNGISKDGKPFHVGGEYVEIDPPRLLVHTWLPDWHHPLHTVVRWELEARDVHGLQHRGPQRAGTGTMVKVRQSGFAGAPEAAEGHRQGWLRVLGWAQAYLEHGLTVDAR